MNSSANNPSGRSAGWIVAAMVAVIAVCAVSFMVSQRPREAIAVAEGDPLIGEAARATRTAPSAVPTPLRPMIRKPEAMARTAPGGAFNAADAASNAAAVEPAR